MECLILQPIHATGVKLLQDAGVTIRHLQDGEDAGSAIAAAHAAITRSAGIAGPVLARGRALLVVSHHGTGTDSIDVGAATVLGIPVASTPDATTASVAEHTVMLMLAAARRAVIADRAARAGDFSFKFQSGFVELRGKTLGIVGMGRVGQAVAEIAGKGFGMRVLEYRRTDGRMALERLLRESDVVSLHLPLIERTRGIVGAAELALMRPGAILVNTARGGLVDEAALADALAAGRIAGAGLDVFEREEEGVDNPLYRLDRAVLSPHAAGATGECLVRAAEQAARNVLDVMAGRRPAHLVNPEIWNRRRLPPEGGPP